MRYQVESQGQSGDWSTQYVAGDDADATFETREEAEAAIRQLQAEGGEWAGDHYRIVEVES